MREGEIKSGSRRYFEILPPFAPPQQAATVPPHSAALAQPPGPAQPKLRDCCLFGQRTSGRLDLAHAIAMRIFCALYLIGLDALGLGFKRLVHVHVSRG